MSKTQKKQGPEGSTVRGEIARAALSLVTLTVGLAVVLALAHKLFNPEATLVEAVEATWWSLLIGVGLGWGGWLLRRYRARGGLQALVALAVAATMVATGTGQGVSEAQAGGQQGDGGSSSDEVLVRSTWRVEDFGGGRALPVADFTAQGAGEAVVSGLGLGGTLSVYFGEQDVVFRIASEELGTVWATPVGDSAGPYRLLRGEMSALQAWTGLIGEVPAIDPDQIAMLLEGPGVCGGGPSMSQDCIALPIPCLYLRYAASQVNIRAALQGLLAAGGVGIKTKNPVAIVLAYVLVAGKYNIDLMLSDSCPGCSADSTLVSLLDFPTSWTISAYEEQSFIGGLDFCVFTGCPPAVPTPEIEEEEEEPQLCVEIPDHPELSPHDDLDPLPHGDDDDDGTVETEISGGPCETADDCNESLWEDDCTFAGCEDNYCHYECGE